MSLERIVKAESPQRYTLGVVYEPGVVDTDGDWASAGEIEKACRAFGRKLQRPDAVAAAEQIIKALSAVDKAGIEIEIDEDLLAGAERLGIQHGDWAQDGREIVESYIAPCDLAIPQPDGGVAVVPKGSWLLGAIWSDAGWAAVCKGDITGYSLSGLVARKAVPSAG